MATCQHTNWCGKTVSHTDTDVTIEEHVPRLMTHTLFTCEGKKMKCHRGILGVYIYQICGNSARNDAPRHSRYMIIYFLSGFVISS